MIDFNPTWLSIFLVIASCIFYVIYKFFTKEKNWWEAQGVPVFHSSIFHYISLYTNRSYFLDLEVSAYKKLGKIYGRYDGILPVLTVGDPEMLKDILVKDFHIFPNRRDMKFGDPMVDNNVSILSGNDWKRVRNVMSPTFTSGKLRKMLPKIEVCSSSLFAVLKTASETGVSVDLHKTLGAYVLDVIASCAFGAKLNSLNDPDNPFVSHAKGFLVEGCNSLRSILPVLFPSLMKLFKISMLNPASTKFFHEFTLQIMEERKKLLETETDYLQLLLEAGKNEENAESENKQRTKTLSEDEIAAQCIVFFFAGFDTVTSILQFILYAVARDEKIQEKLSKEIDDTIQDKEELAYEDFMNMKYLDKVVSEALRLATGCIRMERRAEEDYKLRNIFIKKGQLISIPMYAIHHDSDFYPDPHVFDPERFSIEAKESRHPFSYLPFGLGPRNCVASRFALMEVKFTITKILKHYRVRLSPETEMPLGFSVKQGTLCSNHVFVTLDER